MSWQSWFNERLDGRPGPSWAQRLIPTHVPSRLLLFFPIVLLQLAAEGLRLLFGEAGSPLPVLLQFLLRLGSFALIFLIAWPQAERLLRPWRRWLILTARVLIPPLIMLSLGELIGLVGSLSGPHAYHNDAIALNHRAQELLLSGHNPYAEISIVSVLEDYQLPATRTTPLRRGLFAGRYTYPTEGEHFVALHRAQGRDDDRPAEFESKVSYPAGSFLLPLPFLALGLPDLRLFYLGCALALVGAIVWRTPPWLRPLALLGGGAAVGLWSNVTGGTIDTMYGLFLFLGWVLRGHLWASALFLGLAATSKQLSWFYIIFFLVLLLREQGQQRMMASLSGILGVFAVTNLPFAQSDPEAWLGGVLSPLLDPMFPKGVGLVSLSLSGLRPQFPALFFAAIEVGALACALVWYYYHCRRAPETGLLLAVLPLFFAWRSLPSYFFLVALLTFGAVLAAQHRDRAPVRELALVVAQVRRGRRG